MAGLVPLDPPLGIGQDPGRQAYSQKAMIGGWFLESRRWEGICERAAFSVLSERPVKR